jgi:hypothetical protein
VTDRGKETSNALTEVRTTLSRAETALAYIVHGPTEGHSVYDSEGRYSGYEREFDSDHEEMERVLREVVVLLSPWRRKGSRRK